MIKKYRKQIEVQAIQWTGDTIEAKSFLGNNFIGCATDGESIAISGRYGDDIVRCGDYIVKDDRGRYTVCSQEVFEQTYFEEEQND